MKLMIRTAEDLQAEANKNRIAELKKFLRDTDYIAMPDYDGHKPDVLASRQAAREEIRRIST